MSSVWLALALLFPLEASADLLQANALPRADEPGTVQYRVKDLTRTVADMDASNGTVWQKAQDFEVNNVDLQVSRTVQTSLRGWNFGAKYLGTGREKSLAEIITGAREAISDLRGVVPPPELRDALNSADASLASGQVQFSTDMEEGQMGRFLFTEGRRDTGLTQVNRVMAQMAGLIGAPLAFMTQLHEDEHRMAHERGELSAERVIEGEMGPFMKQFLFLRLYDPDGERVAYASAWLQNLIRRNPGWQLPVDALQYLDHATRIRATDGDRDAMRRLIIESGYREGAGHHHGDGHDHGPHPTRA